MSSRPLDDRVPTAAGSSEPTSSVMGVPSDNTTLVHVLDALSRGGYRASFDATTGGRLTCSKCGRESAADDFVPEVERRLEGASDPADEMLVLGGRCGRCSTPGVLIVGFGPEASADDVEVLGRLPTGRG